MSDGCAGQYKNCYNFTNLCHHEVDFGVPAEWHFFATSHGKSAADGIGGTVKRTATKASLQRPFQDQILTPEQLYEFVSKEITGIHFAFATVNEYEDEAKRLMERLSNSRTIPGTRSFHSFIPKSVFSVEVKPYSNCMVLGATCTEKTFSTFEMVQLSTLQGYVTVAYEDNSWLGYVMQVNQEARLVEVNFLESKVTSSVLLLPTAPGHIGGRRVISQ